MQALAQAARRLATAAWLFAAPLGAAATGSAKQADPPTDYVVVVGRALDQAYVPDLELACPPDHVCMDSVTRWDLHVSRVVRGPPLRGRITVSRIEHALFRPEALRRFRTFVLFRLGEENQAWLRTEYFLAEIDADPRRLCTNLRAADLGLRPWPYTPRKHDEAPCYDLRHGATMPWPPAPR